MSASEHPRPEQATVDLDLDVIAPPERTFRFKGSVYRIPGDVPVTTLIRASQLRETMDVDSGSTEDEQREAISAMFDLVMELIKAENPEAEELNVSVPQLLYLIGLILSGVEGVTMNQAIEETLQPPAKPKKKEDADHPPTSRRRAKAA